MYKLQLKFVADDEARLNGVFAVIVTLLFQIFLLVELLALFFSVDMVYHFLKHSEYKTLGLASFGIILITFCFLTYNRKRGEKLIKGYDARIKNIFSIKYIVLFSLFTIGPLIIGIYINKNFTSISRSEVVTDMPK